MLWYIPVVYTTGFLRRKDKGMLWIYLKCNVMQCLPFPFFHLLLLLLLLLKKVMFSCRFFIFPKA